MIKGKLKVKLTTDAILDKISEYDVFRYYMPNKDWKLNHVTLSPFRRESNPSFLIGNKRGYISFIDFADTSLRGDCFTFVKKLHSLATLDDVLLMIDRDFGLGILTNGGGQYKTIVNEYKQPEAIKRNALIQVVTRKFNTDELAYWNSYHQSIDDLRANNIYAIKKVYLNKELFYIPDNELKFGYLYEGGYWKIYRPFSDKKHKWMPNNVPITAMDGMDDVKYCRMAFINKSKKDYMVMKKIYPHCCAVQNEGIGCFSEENVNYLKEYSDIQILSFDSDVTGVQNSQQITKLFNFEYCNVPQSYLKEGIKDWADLSRKYGLKIIEDILKQKNII